MNKKTAHLIIFIGDLFCFWCLWIGYHDFQRILIEIHNQTDLIRFSNRLGFFIFGIVLPPIHFVTIVEHLWPSFVYKYKTFLGRSSIIMVVALFPVGFASSTWIKSQVENAGYFYCRQASGASALAKSLIYTKDMEICEDLVGTE